MPNPQSFPELLRTYRKLHGLTQEDLAGWLGFSKHTIAAWERGKRVPGGTLIPDLAEKLEIGKAELYTVIVGVSNIVPTELAERNRQGKGIDVQTQNSSIAEYLNQEQCELDIHQASRYTKIQKILTIRGEKYFIGTKSLLYSNLTSKRAKDSIIKVLVLSPNAPHLTDELARNMHKRDVDDMKKRMNTLFHYLELIKSQNENFDWRVYDKRPNFKILMFDDVMFVSSFDYGRPKNDTNTKMYKLKREGNSLFVGLEREFDGLWESSVPLQQEMKHTLP